MTNLNYSIGVPQFQTEVKFINPFTQQEIPMYNIANELMKKNHSDLEEERFRLSSLTNAIASDLKQLEVLDDRFSTVEVTNAVKAMLEDINNKLEVAKSDYAAHCNKCDEARSNIIKTLNDEIKEYKDIQAQREIEMKRQHLQKELDALEN